MTNMTMLQYDFSKSLQKYNSNLGFGYSPDLQASHAVIELNGFEGGIPMVSTSITVFLEEDQNPNGAWDYVPVIEVNLGEIWEPLNQQWVKNLDAWLDISLMNSTMKLWSFKKIMRQDQFGNAAYGIVARQSVYQMHQDWAMMLAPVISNIVNTVKDLDKWMIEESQELTAGM